MQQKWTKELQAAAALTFEEMCLLMPDEITEGKLNSEDPLIACVQFHGPLVGAINVAVDRKFLPELIEHIVGEDELDNIEVLLDGLGEIANVIAGNLLPKIAGSQSVFALDVPKPVIADSNCYVQNVDNRSLLVFEGGDVEVWMHVESGA